MEMKERGSERIEFVGNDESSKNILIDLSTTGAAFLFDSEQKKDTPISVAIKEYTLDAVVVYCQQRADGYRIGLRFTNVPADVQSALKTLVEEFSRGVPLTCEIVEGKKKKKDE